MPAFAFETITAAQALSISSTDALVFFSTQPSASIHASAATVIYDSPSLITISVAGHAVDFGVAIEGASLLGNVAFFDSSTLYIGDDHANAIAGGSTVGNALFGGLGDDSLQASGAFDLLQGNAGADNLQATGGSSTVYGGQDNDTIVVAGLNNFVQANKGADTIQGQALGVDTILGGQGDDHITGGGLLDGNLGDDSISGTGQLLGEDGNDTLVSPGSHDVLSGGNGNDSISAAHGIDSVNGGAGDDTINGSSNGGTLAGGGGSDKFILGPATAPLSGGPQIVDWDGAHDTVSFTGFTFMTTTTTTFTTTGPVTTTTTNFTSGTAADYSTALNMATDLMGSKPINFVEVQVGADVFVFAGDGRGVAAEIDLVGRSLTDFTTHNLG